MPELPEVETVCRSLKPLIINTRIKKIDIFRDKLRYHLPIDLLKQCHNQLIINISRRAKYLIIALENHYNIIVHLGMSGRFTLVSSTSKERLKHDHVYFYLSDGNIIAFNDARRFGLIDVLAKDDLIRHRYFVNLGPEPLSSEFNQAYFFLKLKNTNSPIKNFIMDAKIVVGVGNIYASESLYLAKIKPTRIGNSLTAQEIISLISAIKATLHKAIAAGGSTLRDFVSGQGQVGHFQKNFTVYGKDKAACPTCATEITKIVQAGRATFYCDNCQL